MVEWSTYCKSNALQTSVIDDRILGLQEGPTLLAPVTTPTLL